MRVDYMINKLAHEIALAEIDLSYKIFKNDKNKWFHARYITSTTIDIFPYKKYNFLVSIVRGEECV